MKILVTGAASFIGSAVTRHTINNTTDQVINLDELTYAGNLELLVTVKKINAIFLNKLIFVIKTPSMGSSCTGRSYQLGRLGIAH